jgi:hypothetical protein
MPTLLDFARSSGIAFESSPSGRWVKFYTGSGQVYVVEGAWGNNYLVWTGAAEAEPEAIERFMRPEEALNAVFRLAS